MKSYSEGFYAFSEVEKDILKTQLTSSLTAPEIGNNKWNL